MVTEREKRLKAALTKLAGIRAQVRANRAKSSLPTIAVVGYTNAGKMIVNKGNIRILVNLTYCSIHFHVTSCRFIQKLLVGPTQLTNGLCKNCRIGKKFLSLLIFHFYTHDNYSPKFNTFTPRPGKTSLIRAITQDSRAQGKNQLFATLDVTAHGCRLPCGVEVAFIDTVGFIQDIPTDLLASFKATLEDAIYSVSFA